MIAHIILEGDNALAAFKDRKVVPVDNDGPLYLIRLPSGMQSGESSVAFASFAADGSLIFTETSMKLFLAAAHAFEAAEGRNNEG